ncbi:hypothetical protein GH714_018559 [Hevea brasiliensis]|nr:hypothetical protein GH714_018559 [Hevea brasiliensis]
MGEKLGTDGGGGEEPTPETVSAFSPGVALEFLQDRAVTHVQSPPWNSSVEAEGQVSNLLPAGLDPYTELPVSDSATSGLMAVY